jgi:hypothetical protein
MGTRHVKLQLLSEFCASFKAQEVTLKAIVSGSYVALDLFLALSGNIPENKPFKLESNASEEECLTHSEPTL